MEVWSGEWPWGTSLEDELMQMECGNSTQKFGVLHQIVVLVVGHTKVLEYSWEISI